MKKERYGAIDALKSVAAFGIVLMHMRANNQYAISGYIYDVIISSFTNLVYLFMVLSAFGLCCGYYEVFLRGKVNLYSFYRRRFIKIFPFFSVLVLIDVLNSRTIAALYEGFADLSLLFGYLPYPNRISVIGVGWYIGLVFVFYIFFPFYTVLIRNKKSAWISFGLSILLNLSCEKYFDVGRYNILYSGCFFIAGGLLYLYRDRFNQLTIKTTLPVLVGLSILYYIVGGNTITWLIMSCALLVFALSCNVGLVKNKAFSFVGNLSMEIYLSHMLVFRIAEKMKLNRCLGDGWVQYCFTCIVVMAGTIVFSFICKKIVDSLIYKFLKMNRA